MSENNIQAGTEAGDDAINAKFATQETGKLFQDLSATKLVNETTQVPILAMEDDFHKLPGQKYAVVSFVDASNYTKIRCEGQVAEPRHLIKIRGVFNSVHKAEEHVKVLQQLDPYFDLHVIETHKWTPIGAFTASEQRYPDQKIQDVMTDYFAEEDYALSNLQSRVKAAKENNTDRTEEATKFWQNAQGLMDDSNSEPEKIIKPVAMTCAEAVATLVT